jgi:glycosyltransferase involved in cell wall biosynthesis
MAGVPVVVNTLHGFYFHDGMAPNWRTFYIRMEKIAARFSDAILSQNREDIETAISEGICPPDRIKFLGNGIDVHRFDRNRLDPATLARLRMDLGLVEGAPVVGFVGRLVVEKGVLELLQAARLVLDHAPQARFLIVGPIDEDKPDALNPEIANSYDIAGACIFTGMRQDMPELYGLMDVFVLPSHREGFPRSPMEASAMRVPCVVTDIRGCREAVEQGRNGLLVRPESVTELAEAIISLLDQPDTRARMGNAGREMALQRFDEELVFKRVKTEYRRLLLARGIAREEAGLHAGLDGQT